MQAILAVIVGGLLVLTAWLSVLRTVFTPRDQPTRAARWSVQVVAAIGLPIARRLPPRSRERFLDPCAPLALFVMAAGWLTGITFGFVLLASGIYAVPFSSDAVSSFFLLPSPGEPLVVMAILSIGLLLTAFTTHLVRFTGSYSRRERLVARLAGQAARPPDAEALLAEYLRAGSRDRLDNLFAEWAGWLADVWCTHVGYPALTFARPANSLCWIRAAVIVLDAAGLTLAVAPRWAPPYTRSLIHTGSRCLQHLAKQVGVTPASAPVSLHGREEQGFSDSMRLVVDSGLPKQRDEQKAWDAFQDLRIHYAPYAAGIAARLLYRDVDETPDLAGDKAVGHVPPHTDI
ncbi:MAG TPA: hypothetical protein VFU43_16145 [Streptosporangiaceae bacterium]|nr:hypothetical protein [Streptosporangiaceae bacterium]